jgi:hypothetical protein
VVRIVRGGSVEISATFILPVFAQDFSPLSFDQISNNNLNEFFHIRCQVPRRQELDHESHDKPLLSPR